MNIDDSDWLKLGKEAKIIASILVDIYVGATQYFGKKDAAIFRKLHTQMLNMRSRLDDIVQSTKPFSVSTLSDGTDITCVFYGVCVDYGKQPFPVSSSKGIVNCTGEQKHYIQTTLRRLSLFLEEIDSLNLMSKEKSDKTIIRKMHKVMDQVSEMVE